MEEFNRYFESYVWLSYWKEYFWPLAVNVGIALFLALCVIHLAIHHWTMRQVKWCQVILLLGMGILFQDLCHAYRVIEGPDYKYIYGKSEEIDFYSDKLYTAKGELLGDDILLKGYFSYEIPTTFLGENIQILGNRTYRDGSYFPFVVIGKKDGEYTIRVSPPYDYTHYSEEITVSQEESEAEGWSYFYPYRAITEVWLYQYGE